MFGLDPLAFVGVTSYILGAGMGIMIATGLRTAFNKGKVWLVEANSNSRTARIARVKADREGYQVKNGPYVKFEGNYAFLERTENRPLFMYNGDTGFTVRMKLENAKLQKEDQEVIDGLAKKYPAIHYTYKTGETSEMDGVVYAAAKASDDVATVQRSHGGIPWVNLALIAGATIIGVIGVVVWLVSKYMQSR